ncbi:hypothetical protein GCM10027610_089790 [Dactylosporangium cerinum]
MGRRIIVGVLAGAVVAVVAGLLTAGRGGDGTAGTAATSAAAGPGRSSAAAADTTSGVTPPASPGTSPTTAPATAPASTAPATVVVPALVGKNAAAARIELEQLGFRDVRFGSQEAGEPDVVLPQNWTVARQSAAAGTRLSTTTQIVLTCTRRV